MQIVALLAELNGAEMQAADVGNAHLEAVTLEKVCFIAGPEFWERARHALIICKALRGLRTSGTSWTEKFLMLSILSTLSHVAEIRVIGCLMQETRRNTSAFAWIIL